MTLNGPLAEADHPAVPLSLEEPAADALACVAAGARAFHVHPRDDTGTERPDGTPAVSNAGLVAAVRRPGAGA